MRINAKTRYALKSLIEIGLNSERGGTLQKDIAQKYSLSVKYLDQIIVLLKTGGLIIGATRGRGGYVLRRKPEDISLFDFYISVEPKLLEEISKKENDYSVASQYWDTFLSEVISLLKKTTLKDMIDQQQQLDAEREIDYVI